MIECKMDDLNAYLKYRGNIHRDKFWIKHGKFREIEEFSRFGCGFGSFFNWKELYLDVNDYQLEMLHRYYDEHVRPIIDKNTLMSIILNGDDRLKSYTKFNQYCNENKRLTQVRKEQKEFLKRTMKSRYAWI